MSGRTARCNCQVAARPSFSRLYRWQWFFIKEDGSGLARTPGHSWDILLAGLSRSGMPAPPALASWRSGACMSAAAAADSCRYSHRCCPWPTEAKYDCCDEYVYSQTLSSDKTPRQALIVVPSTGNFMLTYMTIPSRIVVPSGLEQKGATSVQTTRGAWAAAAHPTLAAFA